MATKRLTIELPLDQYEFLLKEAGASGITISGFIRKLIQGSRCRLADEAAKNYQSDPLFRRRGVFDGPEDLSENHDRYLYQ